MRIQRLRLRDLQRHADLDMEFAPGVTVIRGPNEAGKSTVQRALELALFRRVTATGRDLEAARRWGSGDDTAPLVEFEDDGIAGRLTKRFAGQRGTVELKLGDQQITDPAEVDRRLAELTGLPSEKFFRSTASVHHQELAALDRDEATLRDRLEASMTGADRGTSLAKRRLEDAIRRYTTEGPKNPGQLKVTRERVAALEAELAAGEADLARLEADRAALSMLHAKRAEADERLRGERAKLDASERAVALLTQKQDAEGRYERFKRAAELRRQIQEKEATHPSTAPLPALRNAVGRLRQFEQRISEIRAELVAESDVGSWDINARLPRWKPWAILAVLLLFGTLSAGGAFLSVGTALLPVVLGLAGGVLLSALIALVQRHRAGKIARRNELAEEQIARRLRGRSEREQELVNNERARNEELARLQMEDTATAERILAEETEHSALIDKLNAEYRGVLGGTPPVGDVSVLRDRAAAEIEEKTFALQGMGEIGADPAASVMRYRETVDAAQRDREDSVAEEARAMGRVDQNAVDAEQVATAAERLADARERLATYERRVRIYEAALRSLVSAEQATIKKAARFLEQRMGSDVGKITRGRYRRISVDEEELTFRVWSPELPGWVDVRELSQGTLDQFYLAARLGLVRQVTQDRRPPLIFDDPFVTFDDERASQALQLIKEIAGDHQVLLLTCSKRYDSVADKVIELPKPKAVDASAAGESGTHRGDGRGSGGHRARAASRRERAEPAANRSEAPA
jgi:uncharacterized protein YhaN